MNYQYEIVFSADLGAMLPPVGKLCDSLNSTLADGGMNEKLMVRSEVIRGAVTSKRLLTKKEIEAMKKVLLEEFQLKQPTWKIKIESFQRTSKTPLTSV